MKRDFWGIDGEILGWNRYIISNFQTLFKRVLKNTPRKMFKKTALFLSDGIPVNLKRSIPGREKKPLKPTWPLLASERAVVGLRLIPGWHLETPILCDERSTGCTIHSSFLVLSGLEKGFTLDVITSRGQSTTISLCIGPLSAWWRQTNERTNKKPGDPSARLLLISEKAVFCNKNLTLLVTHF